MRKRKKSPYKILTIDPWLLPYRRTSSCAWIAMPSAALPGERSLSRPGYLYYGFHKGRMVDLRVGPGADAIHLVSFNNCQAAIPTPGGARRLESACPRMPWPTGSASRSGSARAAFPVTASRLMLPGW